MSDNAILLVSCPDQKGITASITQFIFHHNGNIEHADQHIDNENNTFFMRVEWSLGSFSLAKDKIADAFLPLAQRFGMRWELSFTSETPRMAIFVSKASHCLYDLLLKYRQNHFRCEIPLIISNHPQLKSTAESFNIPFYIFEKSPLNKKDIEKKELSLLKKENIELIVLARYGQTFTRQFIDEFPNRMINIHHSFLPAFAGSQPYAQAWQRGVKIIGATSHYVIEELDAGPIIEQDTVRVSHRNSLNDLKREGQDLERVVLSRAVRWHLERKILAYANKTVVFD